jgi:hypothetical protein
MGSKGTQREKALLETLRPRDLEAAAEFMATLATSLLEAPPLQLWKQHGCKETLQTAEAGCGLPVLKKPAGKGPWEMSFSTRQPPGNQNWPVKTRAE